MATSILGIIVERVSAIQELEKKLLQISKQVTETEKFLLSQAHPSLRRFLKFEILEKLLQIGIVQFTLDTENNTYGLDKAGEIKSRIESLYNNWGGLAIVTVERNGGILSISFVATN